MIVGADVTHPSPQLQQEIPSIAAVKINFYVTISNPYLHDFNELI